MKSLLITFALLSVSTLASAGLVGDFPKVQFGSTFVSVEDICLKGDSVETLNPVEVCVKRSVKKNTYCDKTESKILSTPVNYTTEIEVGHHKMETIELSIPTEYSIPFGVVGGKSGFHVVKYVDYTLPVCE